METNIVADISPPAPYAAKFRLQSSTLGLRNQACPKYPKQLFYLIFIISQGKREG